MKNVIIAKFACLYVHVELIRRLGGWGAGGCPSPPGGRINFHLSIVQSHEFLAPEQSPLFIRCPVHNRLIDRNEEELKIIASF